MIEISYEKIKENILKFDLNDYLVLKSNAYGFGFRRVLDIAVEASIYKFCVIDLMDAIYIKEKYPFARVLLLGVFDPSSLLIYYRYDIEISINDLSEIALLKGYSLNVQLKVNTGMNRFGIQACDVVRALELLKSNNLNLTGIYTHNATNSPLVIKQQKEAFFYALKEINDIDIHYAASSLLNDRDKSFNSKRIGEAIYNGALSIYGKIIKINFLYKNESIGYDYSYKMKEDGYIGIIDLGYADGLERNCGGYFVYINNCYYPLIGKACMNYSFVLIDENVELFDRVHFISNYNNIYNYQKHFGKIKHEIYIRFLSK